MSGVYDIREEGELTDEETLLDRMRDELLESQSLNINRHLKKLRHLKKVDESGLESIIKSPEGRLKPSVVDLEDGKRKGRIPSGKQPLSRKTTMKVKDVARGHSTRSREPLTRPLRSSRNSGSRRSPSPRRSPLGRRRDLSRDHRRISDDKYSRALAEYQDMKASDALRRRRSRDRNRQRSRSRERFDGSPKRAARDSKILPETEKPVVPEAEEEDLSLLELRRRALESAASKVSIRRKNEIAGGTVADEIAKGIDTADAASGVPEKDAFKYWVSESPQEAPCPPAAPDQMDELEPVPPGTTPPPPPIEEVPSAPFVIGEELLNILKMENQQEQLQEFIQYVIRTNPAQDKTTQLMRLVEFARSLCARVTSVHMDDYEPISMDLDSNVSSPAPSMTCVPDSGTVNPDSIPLPPPPPLPPDPPRPSTPPPPGTATPPVLEPYEPYQLEGTEEFVYIPTPSVGPGTQSAQSTEFTQFNESVGPRNSAEDLVSNIVEAAKQRSKVRDDEERDEDEDELRMLVLQSLTAKRRTKEQEEAARLTDGLLALPQPQSTLSWQQLLPPNILQPSYYPYPLPQPVPGHFVPDYTDYPFLPPPYQPQYRDVPYPLEKIPEGAPVNQNNLILAVGKKKKRRRRPADQRRMMRRKDGGKNKSLSTDSNPTDQDHSSLGNTSSEKIEVSVEADAKPAPEVESSPVSVGVAKSGVDKNAKSVVKGPVAELKKEVKRTVSPMTIRVDETPQHQPVIISLGYDSDTSDDCDEAHKKMTVTNNTVSTKASTLTAVGKTRATKIHPEAVTGAPFTAKQGAKQTDVTNESEIKFNLGKTPGVDLEMKKRSAIMNRLALKNAALFKSSQNLISKSDSSVSKVGQSATRSRIDETAKKILETLMSAKESAVGSEVVVSEGSNLKKNIVGCEEQLKKYRFSLSRDELSLREEKRRLEEKKSRFVDTMSTVSKLREQLAASERVLAALDKQVKQSENQVKIMQSKIAVKRKTTIALVQRIASVRKIVEGKKTEKPNLKRKPDWPISPISEKRPTEAKQILERRRSGLKSLQKDLTRKLDEYKQISWSKSRDRLSSESFNHLADKIPLQVNNSDIVVENSEDFESKPSLLDLNKSTLPQLDRTPEKLKKSTFSVKKSSITEKTQFEVRKKGGKEVVNKESGNAKSPVMKSKSSKDSVENGADKDENVEEKGVDVLKQFKPLNAEKRARLNRIFRERIEKEKPSSSCISTLCSSLSTNLQTAQEIPYLKFEPRQKVTSRDRDVISYSHYTSPLRVFRGYRLHRFYRTKEELSLFSPLFSHSIKPAVALCRFEMNGTCNDRKCPWQHKKDYVLDVKLTLQDLVSYSPRLTGSLPSSQPSSQQYQKSIEEYVDRFHADHKDVLTVDQIGVLLSSRVNESRGVKHPHTTPLEARPWTPVSGLRLVKLEENSSDFAPTQSKKVPLPSRVEARYFPANDVSEGLQLALESRVLEEPENVHLWLELARGKLCDDSRESIENCLNVLSRGLERNRESSELWLFYLPLYAREAECGHLTSLCEQAITFTHDYHVWNKYLELMINADTKNSLCERILSMLVDDKNLAEEERSHYLVETLLYSAQLTYLTQSAAAASKILQAYLTSGHHADVIRKMTWEDLTFAYLCHAHLVGYQAMPANLWLEGQLGKLVNKTLFVMEWSGIESRPSIVSTVLKRAQRLMKDAPRNVRLVILKNLVKLHLNTDTKTCVTLAEHVREELNEETEGGCDQEDLWMLYVDTVYRLSGLESAETVLKEAVVELPHSPVIHYYWASLLHKEHTGQAIELLKTFVTSLYDVVADTSPKEYSDPSFLYKCVLRLDSWLDVKKPPFRSSVNEKLLEERIVHLWLNYALLLQLTGDEEACCDVYETALSRLNSQHDVQLIWIGYLKYKRSRLQECSSHQLGDLLRRCLTTSPCQYPLIYTHSSESLLYNDYSFHNMVAEMYLSWLSRDNKMAAYQRILQIMPDNTAFRENYVRFLEETGSVMLAGESSKVILYDNVVSPLLVRSALSHALREGKPREVRKILRRCTELMPYSAQHWKNYVLYEIAGGADDVTVTSLVRQAAQLGVHLDGFVATLLK